MSLSLNGTTSTIRATNTDRDAMLADPVQQVGNEEAAEI
jgi:hypothetical protein